jgi:DNA-binding MarR family transcriptional regulator
MAFAEETKRADSSAVILDSFFRTAARSHLEEIALPPESSEFHLYFQAIAEARYVIRKVFRIIDEQAKAAGLDPLEHQVLIQVFGARKGRLRVSDVAERLDITPPFASRLIKTLEGLGFVVRSPSEEDRRTVFIDATDAGRDVLGDINKRVHAHIGDFQQQLDESQRLFALAIFAFYVGAAAQIEELEQLGRLSRDKPLSPHKARR